MPCDGIGCSCEAYPWGVCVGCESICEKMREKRCEKTCEKRCEKSCERQGHIGCNRKTFPTIDRIGCGWSGKAQKIPPDIERKDLGVDGNKEMCCCHQKATPRKEQELKQLKNRLNRIIGQLNGIGKMLDENRYCGDILTQLAAAESALQSFGYEVLKEHMETCMVEEISRGNTDVVDEAVELIKKLK